MEIQGDMSPTPLPLFLTLPDNIVTQEQCRHMATHNRQPTYMSVLQQGPSGGLVMRRDAPPRSTTSDPSRSYACNYPGCSKRFERPVDLDTHIRSHTGEKPFICRYPGCVKAFSVKSNMTRHEKTHTAGSQFV
ncbi:hypothetical protein M422DRAFT_239086 [Sphaerobolus stellatus SS14]|nr:hypothetical protein M422DRAFT_239086 [Sphaerobolus stellatus SS14]